MKKLLSLVLCAALVLTFAVGATAESGRDGYVNTGKLQYDTTKEVNGGKDMTLEFWVQVELGDIYQKWCDAYTALHPNIKFNITLASHDDHFTKLGMALPAGKGPQLFHMHNAYIDQFAANLKPYDTSVMPLDTLREDYSLINESMYNGQLYYVGLGIMTAGIFYNPQLWADAGLTDADIPQTWDQLVAVAKKLTKVDDSGKMTVAGFNYNEMGMEYLLTALNYQKGAPMFEKDSKTPVFGDTFKENAQWLKDLYDVEKVGSTEMPMSILSFSEGTSAMTYAWGWFGSWMQQNKPDMKYGFFKLPTWDGKTPAAYDRLNAEVSPAINANVTDEEYAVINDFLCFLLTNDNFNLDFALTQYTTPAKKCLANNAEVQQDPVLGISAQVMDRIIYPGAFPEGYFTAIKTHLYEDMMLNGVSLDDALAACEEEINDTMDTTDFVSVESQYAHADELGF